jgi:hypothetical protein
MKFYTNEPKANLYFMCASFLFGGFMLGLLSVYDKIDFWLAFYIIGSAYMIWRGYVHFNKVAKIFDNKLFSK